MGAGDLQPLLADRCRHVVQKAGPVAAVDLQHRVRVAGTVIHHHPRRHQDRPHPPAQQRARRTPDLLWQRQPPRQRLVDQHVQPGQPMRRIERTARRILDPERVERVTVGQRMDPRVDDAGPRHGKRPRDLAEQPGVVSGVDCDFRHRPRRQRLRIDGQRCAPGLRIADQPRMPGVGFGIETQPIAGVAEAHVEIGGRTHGQ